MARTPLLKLRRQVAQFAVVAATTTAVVVGWAAPVLAADLFQPAVEYPVGPYPTAVAVGDLNGDGWPDVVAADQTGNGVDVLLNDGTGALGAAVAYPALSGPDGVVIADFNGDGHADVGVSAWNDVAVLPGDGTGVFGAALIHHTGKATRDVVTADFNDDGHPDLAIANKYTQDVSVLLGVGDGTFADQVDYPAATTDIMWSIRAGDVTGDGVVDLVAASSRNVWVLAGHGDGTFGTPQGHNAGFNGAATDVAIGDLNQDGVADLVAVGGFGVTVLLGPGFGAPAVSTVCNTPTAVHVRDVNLDGHPDVVAACSGNLPGGPGGITVLTGHGDGSLDAPVLYSTRLPNRSVSVMAAEVADLDRNGKPDVVSANEGTADPSYDLPGAVSVLLNVAVPPATVPAAPPVTAVNVGSHSATITWLRPADGGSPILGYTVTAQPGGQSCSTDGPDALSCTITGLTNGVNYTFTVTARNAVGASTPPPDAGGGGIGTPVVTATPGTPPPPVTGVEPVRDPGDGTQVTLHWLAAASELPIVGYQAAAQPGGAFCTTTGALFCTITGLDPATDYTFTVVAINAAGSSDPSNPVELPRADTTPPELTISGVSDGAKYPLGTVATPTCTATDTDSGLAGPCQVSVSGGNTNGVGAFTVTATATDRAGNTTTRMLQYRIVYQWSGLLQPVDDPAAGATIVSVFKAGSTVPVKFTLTGPNGQPIQPVSPPVWLTPAKGGPTTLPIDENVYDLPSDSGSTYRYTNGQWQYNWKTDKAQAGYYWRIGVQLDDGETHLVTIALR
jgi:hypothetical protein